MGCVKCKVPLCVKTVVFWTVALYSLVGRLQSFEGTSLLLFEGENPHSKHHLPLPRRSLWIITTAKTSKSAFFAIFSQGPYLFCIHTFSINSFIKGCIIAQAVSYRLPTAAARVRIQDRLCGICGGQSGTGVAFLQVLRFPLPILILRTAPHSSSIIWGRYNRSAGGRRAKWTQPHPTPRN
jgi:hypothetical protein